MTATCPKIDFSDERHIEQLEAFFEYHGYVVVAEAIFGEENLWADTLAAAAKKVEAVLAFNAMRHGFRGTSKNALRALHLSLPSPTWGIELRTAP